MAEKPEQGFDEQAMDRLGALAPGGLLEGDEVGSHASDTAAAPPSGLTMATPGWRKR